LTKRNLHILCQKRLKPTVHCVFTMLIWWPAKGWSNS
jgi:hypothetical protein